MNQYFFKRKQEWEKITSDIEAKIAKLTEILAVDGNALAIAKEKERLEKALAELKDKKPKLEDFNF